MANLENILEINMAIMGQRNNRAILPNNLLNILGRLIVPDILRKSDNFADIDSNKKDISEKNGSIQNFTGGSGTNRTNLLRNEGKLPYSNFGMFKEYTSAVKDKLYSYYSKVKDTFADISSRIGYTDKLLEEFEDWGVIYFKTAFRKIIKANKRAMDILAKQ